CSNAAGHAPASHAGSRSCPCRPDRCACPGCGRHGGTWTPAWSAPRRCPTSTWRSSRAPRRLQWTTRCRPRSKPVVATAACTRVHGAGWRSAWPCCGWAPWPGPCANGAARERMPGACPWSSRAATRRRRPRPCARCARCSSPAMRASSRPRWAACPRRRMRRRPCCRRCIPGRGCDPGIARSRQPPFAKLRSLFQSEPLLMSETRPRGEARMPLHWKIAIGFFAGLVLGLFVHYGAGSDAGWVQALTHYATTPFSQLFLSLIFMLIVPLLFSALVVGVSEMGDITALGRIGWRTLAWTVVLLGTAVLLGLVLVNLFKPGAGVDPVLAQQLLAEGA